MHWYIYTPSRDMWPGASVNARIRPVRVGTDPSGRPVEISASAWLDRNRPVEQMTWAPGEPAVINDRLVSQGGWTPFRARPGEYTTTATDRQSDRAPSDHSWTAVCDRDPAACWQERHEPGGARGMP